MTKRIILLLTILLVVCAYGSVYAGRGFVTSYSDAKGRKVFVSEVEAITLADDQTADVTGKSYYTAPLEGDFSYAITMNSGSGAVRLWYQVAAVTNTNWLTPTTHTIGTYTGGGPGTIAAAATIIAARFVRFMTQVTGTVNYDVTIMGR